MGTSKEDDRRMKFISYKLSVQLGVHLGESFSFRCRCKKAFERKYGVGVLVLCDDFTSG